MKYKIIVDKQSRTNPSSEKKEYVIDIEELRVKGDVYDSLVITKDEDYVMRRLSLSEYQVLTELETPIKEPIKDITIELFEGDNYIYLVDMVGNKFYAEYIVKNDFTDIYVTTNEMNSAINQSAQSIELNVNQKLTGYSTTNEMNSAINIKANEITSSVSSTYATKNELNTAKSEIKQTTDSITSTVSKKVGNDEVISKINQSAETVSISANKVDLNGYVTVSNLQTAGKTTINGSNITTGTIDASKATITNINADNIKSGTITGRAITGGTITGTSITNGNNFSVDKNGNMTCSNANVSGTITSNNANITGGKLLLHGGNENNPVFQISANDGYTKIVGGYLWMNGKGNPVVLKLAYNLGSSNSLITMSSNSDGANLRVGNGNTPYFFEVSGPNNSVTVLRTCLCKFF